ncbi:MAG: hypothetical protein LC753_20390, partial [Acidobacteria bacterium]|nr:hypothetical protein [Acidobacteriota bacterium]
PMKAIEHVVVLMLENRSFDHVLGSLRAERAEIDGVMPHMWNPGRAGEPVCVRPTTASCTRPDPRHALENVRDQLSNGNSGFVTDYHAGHPWMDPATVRQVMDYYTDVAMPVTYALARNYGISDRWFSSVPALTWPNRLFAHCGTSAGRVTNELPDWFQLFDLDTIYDRLDGDWACYCDHFPQMVVVQSLWREFWRSRHADDSRFRSMEQFVADCHDLGLPKYSFIEPVYFLGFDPPDNDDHAPHDIRNGQDLIAQVYLALRESPSWTSTVLVITYDEHGGFHDHVPPPVDVPAPGGSDHADAEGASFDFRRLGPRVPTLLVSPFAPPLSRVRPGPSSGFFDHTSLISSAAARWGFGALTGRDAAAATFWHALSLAEPRTDDEAAVAAARAWLERRRAEAEPEAARFGTLVGLSGQETAERVAAAATELEAEGELNDLQAAQATLARIVAAGQSPPRRLRWCPGESSKGAS